MTTECHHPYLSLGYQKNRINKQIAGQHLSKEKEYYKPAVWPVWCCRSKPNFKGKAYRLAVDCYRLLTMMIHRNQNQPIFTVKL